jgi:two-component system response regulator
MGALVEVLLAEDHAGDTELILESLAQERFADRIHVVDNGADALDFAFCRGRYAARTADAPPRLIFLDLKLPKLTGLEVLSALKSDARTRAIPVVMLTSSRVERDVAMAYRLGVNSFIHKPMDFLSFRETVLQVGRYWLTLNEPPPISASEGSGP